MTPFVDDPDFSLYVGDVRAVLRELPARSVNCCVSSPPYWGLRDYGTGEWGGGDPECDHARPTTTMNVGFNERWGQGAGERKQEHKSDGQYAGSCPKCGAIRVDRQIGLEPTPDEYVAAIVDVFREVRRVLADDGTLWLNLGDSYAGSWGAQSRGNTTGEDKSTLGGASMLSARQIQAHPKLESRTGAIPEGSGLKPKDLVGIPWLVAFALRADGWYLRSDIIWAKPNPMPESVTDRPTKAHEYVFLLSKSPRYYFDQEAVREPHAPDGRKITGRTSTEMTHENHRLDEGERRERWPGAGRNIRSVWEIATQPYPEAHFATFPEELPRRCIAAGCPEWVCATCGKARERIVKVESSWAGRADAGATRGNVAFAGNVGAGTQRGVHGAGVSHDLDAKSRETLGWSDCGHDDYRPGVVLDPFMGSGTTALVARTLGRRAVGVELSPEYAALCARRLQQQSLFA